MRQKISGRRVTSFGARGRDLLWGGFVGGAALAAILWLYVHIGDGSPSATLPQYTIQSESIALNDKEPTGVGAANPTTTDRKPTLPQAANPPADQPDISVYLADKHTIETVPLEAYVLGVVAAEMPLDFEPAALEAQAMAARTYIVRRLLSDNRDGVPGRKALVTDQVTHQAYLSQAQIKSLSKTNPAGVRKAQQAVERSRNMILTYKGEPIEALFFSASNGYTENSEEVFPNKLPYLRAVPSPGDKESEHSSEATVSMSLKDFYEKMNVSALAAMGRATSKPNIRVLEWTGGHRVKRLLVGSEQWTGEEVRDRLGLRSASFDWSIKDGNISITTHGNGHGVGMSQWGAEGMAKNGSSARQIVEHYYTGIRLTEASKLLENAGRNR